MIVTTVWQGKRAFVSQGPSGNSIRMDASAAYGGDGNGATPMELLLAGLAGCMGIDVTMILERSLPSIESIEITADGTRDENPPKGFTSIDLTFHVKGDVPDYRIWRAIDTSKEKYCSVSDSLKADVIPRLILNGVEVERPA